MKKNKKPYKLLVLALALGFSSSSAQALFIPATVSSDPIVLLSGNNRTVSDDTANNTSVSINPSQTTSAAVGKFDSSLGVLTEVTATLTVGNNTTYLRADGRERASGTATATTSWTGGGLNVTDHQLNTTTKNSSTDAASNTWASPLPQTIDSADFNSWVGAGSLDTTVTTTLTANRLANNGTSSGSATITAGISSSNSDVTDNSSTTPSQKDLTATYQVTYTYLEHAAPSLDSSLNQTVLNLDFNDAFGTIYAGDAVGSLAFSLFNLTGDRVGLDLDFITGSGDTLALTTNLAAFSDLAAGNSFDFLASINTDNAGSFSATYYLSFSDANMGASASRYSFNDYLTLNLTGNVIERSSIAQVNDVPEPGILALMSVGLFGLLGLARRKR